MEIKTFKNFNENIKIKIFTFSNFYKLIYGDGGTPKYKNLDSKIQYFTYSDLYFIYNNELNDIRNKGFYIVMFK